MMVIKEDRMNESVEKIEAIFPMSKTMFKELADKFDGKLMKRGSVVDFKGNSDNLAKAIKYLRTTSQKDIPLIIISNAYDTGYQVSPDDYNLLDESRSFIKESVDISAVKRLLGVTEDNEVVSDFRYDDDLSKLKKDLKALGTKKVGIIPAKYGFKDSLYAYDGTGPYNSEFSLEVSPLKNDREYEIKFSRLRTTESARLSESSSDDEEDFEDFKKKCQANPTYKKAAAIANKYGYQVASLCYVEISKRGKKYINFNVMSTERSYRPQIFFGANPGKEYKFEIQTTSYGALTLDEHTKFIKGVTDAHDMVAELSELDLTTLYEIPMDE